MKIDHKDLSEPALLFALALKDGKLLPRLRSIDTETKECEQAVDAFTTRIVVCDRIVMRETSPGLNALRRLAREKRTDPSSYVRSFGRARMGEDQFVRGIFLDPDRVSEFTDGFPYKTVRTRGGNRKGAPYYFVDDWNKNNSGSN